MLIDKNASSADVITAIKDEFPSFVMRRKSSSTLMRAIDIILRIVTFGYMSTFMTRFSTIIETTLYVPDSWNELDDLVQASTLRHELVHMRQRRHYGSLLFSLMYLIPFFPLGLAYFRFKLEREAYEESLRALHERAGEKPLRDPAVREYYTRMFTGPSYGWAWPFKDSVNKWYDDAVKRIIGQ